RVRDGPAHRRDGLRGLAACEDFIARRVPERARGRDRDRRLEQRAAARRRDRAARGRRDRAEGLAARLRPAAAVEHAAGGKYLGERFHRAGGVPAVMWELLQAKKLAGACLTVTGKSVADNVAGRETSDREMIFPVAAPLRERAGFLVLKGNLFDFAIMKTSVISDEFRARYLSAPGREGVFEGRAVVVDVSDDYHARRNAS